MKNTIKILTFTLFFSFISCNFKTSYYGKYVNRDNKDAINYLIIKKDKSYLHYYKNDSIELSQKGKWEVSDEPYNRINLYNFCNYNEAGVNFKKYDTYFFIKNNKWLDTGFDGHTYGSFEKEEE